MFLPEALAVGVEGFEEEDWPLSDPSDDFASAVSVSSTSPAKKGKRQFIKRERDIYRERTLLLHHSMDVQDLENTNFQNLGKFPGFETAFLIEV